MNAKTRHEIIDLKVTLNSERDEKLKNIKNGYVKAKHEISADYAEQIKNIKNEYRELYKIGKQELIGESD